MDVAATSDPEFMDRRAADLVKARLAQMQELWELTHSAMSAAEGEDDLDRCAAVFDSRWLSRPAVASPSGRRER